MNKLKNKNNIECKFKAIILITIKPNLCSTPFYDFCN